MAKKNLKVEGIGFENFRIFKNRTDMDFRTITILTGTNSSGKSTVINAMRLLKGNYSDLSFSHLQSAFELDSIFSKKFEAKDIIRIYGNLQNVVSFKSGNEFKFSVQKRMWMIDDTAVIDFTVQIQDNISKTGQLVKLEMKSKSTDLFSIKKVTGTKLDQSDIKSKEKVYHQTTIDLKFLYDHYTKWINNYDYENELKNIENLIIKVNDNLVRLEEVQKTIDEVNDKYNSRISILSDREYYSVEEDLHGHGTDVVELTLLKEIKNELNEGRFYDFSILWEQNPKQEELFRKMITNVYRKYDADSLKELTKDILAFLSKAAWKQSFFETDQFGELGLKYLYFGERFTKYLTNAFAGLSLVDYSQRFEDELKAGFKIENDDIITEANVNSVKNKVDLIKYIAILLSRKSYKPSKAENYFYNDFIFHNLNQIKNIFYPFVGAEFVSTERSSRKRSKSILDEDDLSKLSLKYFSSEKWEFEKIGAFLNRWVVEFKIGEEVIFDKDEHTENYNIFVKKNDQKILLADMGFGVSQLLPIMLSCFPGNKIVAVEEPETNLHPALQSKLADFFIDAAQQFNIQFIIETHSEYLIRRLQVLTADPNCNLKPEDTQIYYFNPPDKIPEGKEQVYKINIDNRGRLTKNFGEGFFDVAGELEFLLYSNTN